MNSINLVGNTGKDVAPSLKFDTDGKASAFVTLAVKRPGGKDKTDWFFVKFYRKTAEIAAEYVKKGHKIGIVGVMESYEKDGKTEWVVTADKLTLLEKAGAKSEAADDEIVF